MRGIHYGQPMGAIRYGGPGVVGASDTTAPVVISSSYNDSTKTVNISAVEINPKTAFIVGVANPSTPDADQIQAGTGGGILQAWSYDYENGANSDPITVTDTNIDELHIVLTDVAGNVSDIEIITGVTVTGTFPSLTKALATDYDSDATASTTHTTASFTPGGDKDVLVLIWSRNDNNATGDGTLSALTMNGSSIVANIVEAVRFSGYDTGAGRACMIAARIPAASVANSSQTVSITYGDTHRNVRIQVYEVTGGGTIGNTNATVNTTQVLTSTVSITTSANNSLVLYMGAFETGTATTGTHDSLLNSAESSMIQLSTSEEVASSASTADETYTRASDIQRAGSVAIEILAD